MAKLSDTELFNKEIKQLLSGNIADKDTVNYVAIKITKLYEQHIEKFLTIKESE